MNRLLIIAISMMLGACATLGPSYPELENQIHSVPDGAAHVVFFRTKESSLFFARSAPIAIDEKEVGSCAYGGFFYTDVTEGAHMIKTELLDHPGKCVVKLNATAGEIYYLQVDPRGETFFPFLAGGPIGLAAESYGKECGGAFKLYPTSSELAKDKIRDLKLSK